MIIRIKKHTVPSGGVYTSSNYPGDGAYDVTDAAGTRYLVLVANGCTYTCVNGMSLAEEEVVLPPVINTSGVSEATLLKALAIAQSPTLITEILKHD